MATYPGGIPSLPRPSGSTQMDATGFKGSEVIDGISDELEAVATELGVNPSGAAATVVARLDALDSTVAGKASSSHTHTAANVTDFAESVRDTIGSALVAGTNVTITVNDGADTITIDAAGGGGLTEEQAEDIVNGLLVAGSNISLTYDDVANTLTIAVTGLGTAAALSTADIDERARDAVGSALTAGTGITVTPDDGADTITVATSAVLPTLVDAKGDLLVGTAADTVGRLAVGTNGHVLTADSAEASGVKWAAASGSSAGVWTTYTTSPSGGSDGDFSVQATGVAGDSISGTVQRKASGSWSTSVDAGGNKAHLVMRSVSQTAGIIPGWKVDLTSAMLSSLPADMEKSNLSYSSGFYATSGGSYGWLCTNASMSQNATPNGLTFFSAMFQVSALPDAGRYGWLGQFYCDGSLEGFGVRVDSSGNFVLRVEDDAGGTSQTLASGGTGVTSGCWVMVERFGNRLSAWRSTSSSDETLTSRIDAMIPQTGTGFAGTFGKNSFGVVTNSNTTRLDKVRIYG